jgi:hypothetical protein
VADSGCDDELWLHIFAARIHERRKRGSVAHLKAMRGQLALRMQASQRGFMRGGVWLAGPTARPCTRAWARCTVKGECGSTKDTYGSTTGRLVCPYASDTRAGHVDSVGKSLARCARWRRRPLLFHVHTFEIAKLPKAATKLKISKSRSCRWVIALQLSQRVTYVLVKGLTGKTWWTRWFSQPWVIVHRDFNSIFSQFTLKIWMFAYFENCVPRNNKELYNDRFWTSIVKFGERERKPFQLQGALSVWPWIGILTKGWCAEVSIIILNMLRDYWILINPTN